MIVAGPFDTPSLRKSPSNSSISSAGETDYGSDVPSPPPPKSSRLGPDGPRDGKDRPVNHEFGAGEGAKASQKTTRKRGVRAPTTWHQFAPYNFKTWVLHHDIGPEEIYYTAPKPEEPLPYHPMWRENVWILSNLLRPLALHAGWYYLFPTLKWNWLFALIFYGLNMVDFALNHIRRLNRYQGVYGVFDQENRGRDMISDKQVNWVALSLVWYLGGRLFGLMLLGWDQNEFPTLTWWWPVKVAAWGISLDYFFYVYHRSCHEVDFLWHVHQRHHASHHPTPLLSIYADDVQEALEVVVVPFLGTKALELTTGITLTFAEMYLAVSYLLYYESYGHAGMRVVWGHPLNYMFLRIFGMELIGEDHDIHHRDGKGGMNYGKQTRVWDKLFDTVERRREKQIYY